MNTGPGRRWILPVTCFVLLANVPARAADDADARVAAAKDLDEDGYAPVLPASWALAEVEPNDTPGEATAIDLGVAVDAAIAGTGDEDWYELDTGSGSYVTLSTSSSGDPGTDTVLEAFASDGATRLAADDDSGLGLFSALEHLAVPGDGILLIRVTRYSALGGDDYRLLAEAGAAPPPAPDNDIALAAQLLDECNTAVTGSTVGAANELSDLGCLAVDPVGGDVFYRVTVPFSFELTVLVEPVEGWDLSAYVFSDPADPAGSCIDASDIGYAGEAEFLRFLNEQLPGQDREVYIAVDSWAAASAGSFILSTRCDFVVPNEVSSFSTLKSRFQGN